MYSNHKNKDFIVYQRNSRWVRRGWIQVSFEELQAGLKLMAWGQLIGIREIKDD